MVNTLISMKSGLPLETSDAYASNSSVFHSFTRVRRYTVLWHCLDNKSERWNTEY